MSGKRRRRPRGKIDYVLCIKGNFETQPVASALLEAKREGLPPGHELDQAKGNAECKRLNVQFVLASNGHQFVEFDRFRV
jgi:type I restriction enzyme R subunit